MKHINWTIVLFIMVILMSIPFQASAIDTGLATESLTVEEKNVILEQWEFEKLTEFTPIPISYFDVRSDQMIVVGAKKGETSIIAVYSDDGLFQYGFQTKEPGTFRIMWSGDAIAYYSIRGKLLFEVNQDGTITDVCRVPSSTENSIYEQKTLSVFTRQLDSSTYRMTNGNKVIDALSPSCRKIIKTNDGVETIIYDASSTQLSRTITGIIRFIVVSLIFVGGGIAGFKKHYNKVIDQKKKV